ncbi:MAG: relaxase/mobilization nuclease domain-containing protein [Eubacterium sp.]|nr:relaxase/mobilization nuclease domain-containing protein [Eubacterium sp.]
MATTSLWPIHNSGSKAVKAIVRQVVEYAENEDKTKERAPAKEKASTADPQATVKSVMEYVSDKNEGMKYVTGINCTAEHAVEEMMITKRRWPDKGNRVLYHGYQSFMPGEVTPEQAHRIGVKLAQDLWSERFEVVVATHLDRAHIHNHYVINAMSFVDGTKFIWDEEFPRMQVRSDELCRAESLSVLPPNQDNEAARHIGAIHAGLKGTPTIESIVKEDVDSCVLAASSLSEWYRLMEAKGYRIDDSRKYLRVWPYGHTKCIRIDRRYGSEYTLEALEGRILSHGLVAEGVVEGENEDEAEEVRRLYEELRGRSESDERKSHGTTGAGMETHKGKQNPQTEKGRIKPYTMQRSYKGSSPLIAVQSRLMLPIGIQITYLRFIVRMGYRRTPRQIARIHYLYREELTRLDHYIAETRFLIGDDIHTEAELREKMENTYREISQSKKALQRLYRRSREHPEEKDSIVPQIRDMAAHLQEEKKDYRLCQSILIRTETMCRKEVMVERLKEDPAVAAKQIEATEKQGNKGKQNMEKAEERTKGGELYEQRS